MEATVDYQVNEEALAIREDRKEIHKEAKRDQSRYSKQARADNLVAMSDQLRRLSNKARGLGEPDLAEDIKTCAKFAAKFAAKASKG
jgi:hypothetical protein